MNKCETNGITLIALVITIIVLLILARSSNKYVNRRQWDNRKSRRSKKRNKQSNSIRSGRVRSNRCFG